MRSAKHDPLLVTAGVVTVLVRIGLVAGMVALGIAFAVTVVGGARPDWVQPGVQVSLDDITGAVLVVTMATLISLGLAYDFTSRLASIIATVGRGDPFTLDNAARLRRMAWTAVAIQLVGVPAMLLSVWLKPLLADGRFHLTSDVSLTGFGLSIVLFVLARVFRRGAEMREELEGTV